LAPQGAGAFQNDTAVNSSPWRDPGKKGASIDMSEGKSPTSSQRSDQRQQRAIGQVLARRFTDVSEAPAPDEMIELLKAADTLRGARQPKGGS
jgi:hypothetical protein